MSFKTLLGIIVIVSYIMLMCQEFFKIPDSLTLFIAITLVISEFSFMVYDSKESSR